MLNHTPQILGMKVKWVLCAAEGSWWPWEQSSRMEVHLLPSGPHNKPNSHTHKNTSHVKTWFFLNMNFNMNVKKKKKETLKRQYYFFTSKLSAEINGSVHVSLTLAQNLKHTTSGESCGSRFASSDKYAVVKHALSLPALTLQIRPL